MNTFTTDYPMMLEPPALPRRARWRVLLVASGYFVYILLIGPYLALLAWPSAPLYTLDSGQQLRKTRSTGQ